MACHKTGPIKNLEITKEDIVMN